MKGACRIQPGAQDRCQGDGCGVDKGKRTDSSEGHIEDPREDDGRMVAGYRKAGRDAD